MRHIRSSTGSPVRVGIALTLLCCAGTFACRDGAPTAPAYGPSTVPDQPAPPAPAPSLPAFVVDTGPIPAGRLALELLVFPSSPGGSLYLPRIYTMRTDGTGLLALTPADEVGRAPAWSPDGSRLAYESYHDGTPDIWTVRPDGTVRTLVARAATEPFWLDASHLGYQCGTSLCAIRDDGSEQRVLLARDSNPNAADFSFRLSNDGKTFAFARLSYLATYPLPTYIYLMNVDGTGERILTQATEGSSPQWSPVGRSVAFASAQYDIALADADGGAVTSVSRRNGDSPPRSASSPGWSPSGTELVFGSDPNAFYFARADGTGPIRRVRAAVVTDPSAAAVVDAWAWTSR